MDGHFLGGVAEGAHAQRELDAKTGLGERALALQERAQTDARTRDLLTRAESGISETMKIAAKTIEAGVAAGRSPEQIRKAVTPLLADIQSVGVRIGKDPTTYARQLDALIQIPRPEKAAPGPESPLGKLVFDREQLAAKHGPESDVVRQFDERIKRESAGQDENAFASERQLRQEFTTLETSFRDVDSSFKRLESVALKPSPAGDLALIFNYMKMLDPKSVVRESEFQNAETARPLLQQLGIGWDAVKSVWEGKRLTSEQRTDFQTQARTIHGAAAVENDGLRERYRDLAERHGISPVNVVGADRINGTVPAEAVRFLRENSGDENVRRQFQEKFGLPVSLFLKK